VAPNAIHIPGEGSRQRYLLLGKRIFVLLLLLAVPVLTTLARNNWYLPQSNPGHYLTTASKMKVPNCPVETHRPQVTVIADVAIPQPPVKRVSRTETAPPVPWNDFPASLQRRPPPVFAA
jgi:hypothetical protein